MTFYKLVPKIHKDVLKQQSLMYYQIAHGIMATAVAQESVSNFSSPWLYERIANVLMKMSKFPGDFDDLDFSYVGAYVLARNSYFDIYKRFRSSTKFFDENISSDAFANLQDAARINEELKHESLEDQLVNIYLVHEVEKMCFETRNKELKDKIRDSSREIIKDQNPQLYAYLQNFVRSKHDSFDPIALISKKEFKSVSKQAETAYRQTGNKKYVLNSISLLSEVNAKDNLNWNVSMGHLYHSLLEEKLAKEFFLQAIDIHKRGALKKDVYYVDLFKKVKDWDSVAECYINEIREEKRRVDISRIDFKPDNSTEFFFEELGDYHKELYRIQLKKERGY